MAKPKREETESTTDFALRLVEHEERVRALARHLQAHGPDEFPTGYYLHCARVQIEEEENARA